MDYITPPVDDPVWFGRIAAANALSDVFAMGGRPVIALNLVMFPEKKLGPEVLREILRGGLEKVSEAGAVLAGGHSTDNEEPVYGLAVTGVISPQRILTNCGARPGDALVLTKPLGTGVLFNACRSRRLPRQELDPILPQIAALNGPAMEIALKYDIHACTDVTGFGLAGHSLEMARGSGLLIELEYAALPIHPNVLEMYAKGETTGSNKPNRKLTAGWLELEARLTGPQQELLFDPQTSGGLLLALPAGQADALVGDLRAAGVTTSRIIGQAVKAETAGVRVV
ncbi:selenophosphate synthase [Geothermobacter ehrlichii]|uniref:Selenophosphate synthase n=1 Tax=Geothermobacter ehrlichii TaxID=213224 RepID=A0A5D3WNF7_9BACT|nr:selenophosphate synthase [Geothermobacter ehrlichii]